MQDHHRQSRLRRYRWRHGGSNNEKNLQLIIFRSSSVNSETSNGSPCFSIVKASRQAPRRLFFADRNLPTTLKYSTMVCFLMVCLLAVPDRINFILGRPMHITVVRDHNSRYPSRDRSRSPQYYGRRPSSRQYWFHACSFRPTIFTQTEN